MLVKSSLLPVDSSIETLLLWPHMETQATWKPHSKCFVCNWVTGGLMHRFCCYGHGRLAVIDDLNIESTLHKLKGSVNQLAHRIESFNDKDDDGGL